MSFAVPKPLSKDQKAPPGSSSSSDRHHHSNSDLDDELSASPTSLYNPMIRGVNLDDHSSPPSSTASTPAVMTSSSSSSAAAQLQVKPRRTVNSKLHHILHKDSQHSLNSNNYNNNNNNNNNHHHHHHHPHHINTFFDEWSRSHTNLGNLGNFGGISHSANVSAVSMASAAAAATTSPTSGNTASTFTAASARIPKTSRSVNGLPHLPMNSHRDSPAINSPLSASPTPLQSPITPASPFHGSAPNVKETHYINIDYDPVSGRKMLNKYEVIRELGRGQHGKVKLGRNMETGEYVAIKIVDRTSRPRLGRANTTTQEDKIRREIAILKKCNHPNIVRLLEVLDDATSKKIYLVLEYLEKGEVTWQADNGVPAMSRKEAKSSARDVLLGLEYLHYQGIIHRDIKPANLLLSGEGKVKISDFGVSYASSPDTVDEYELAKTAGTPAFFAPELCMTSADTRPTITSKIDIWALGVTLFCLIYGKVPFMAESEFELFKVIADQELEFPDEKPDNEHDNADSNNNDGAKTAGKNASGVHIPSMFYNSNELKNLGDQGRRVSSPAPAEAVAATETDADLELAKDLLRQLLEKNPDKRIGLQEIKRHPWICDGLDKNEMECFLKGPEDGLIEISPDEVKHAVQGITGKIKRGLSRFGSTALQLAGLRRRKSSASSASSRAWSASTSRSSSREPPRSQANTAASSVAKHSPPGHDYHSRPRYHSMVPDLNDSSRPRSSMSNFTPPSHPHTFPRKGIPSSSSNLNLNAYLEERVKDLHLDTGIDDDEDEDELDYFDGGATSTYSGGGASANALKSSLDDHIIEEVVEPRGRLDLNHVRVGFSQGLSSSSQESDSSDSDSDGDNGELTLVLGPSRAVSQSPNTRLGRSSSLMQHGVRAMTPPTSSSSSSAATARHAAHGSLRLDKTSRSTLQAEIDNDDIKQQQDKKNDKHNDDDKNNDNDSSHDSLSRHRSHSVTVAMIQRPSYME